MLSFLLVGLALSSPASLSVALPTARHAGSVSARTLLWPLPQPDADKATTDAELEAWCGWRGEDEKERTIETLMDRGNMGFSIIEANTTGIWVSGERVLSLQDGLVQDADHRGMSLTGLYNVLLDSVELKKQLQYRCGQGLATNLATMLAIDPTLPFETIQQIVYTAGQAQIEHFDVVVDGPAGALLPGQVASANDLQMKVVFQDDQTPLYSRSSRPDLSPHPGPLADALPALLGEGALGCGLLVPQNDTSWLQIIEVLDDLSGAGATRHVLAGGAETGASALASAPGAPAALALTLQTTVPVFFVRLPTLSADGSLLGQECETEMVVYSGIGGLLGARGTQIGTGGLGSLEDGQQASESGDSDDSDSPLGGSPIVLGALDKSLIEGVIKGNLADIRYCYQQELSANPLLSGKIVIKFVIAKDGSVSKASIKASTMSSSAVESCLTERFMAFEFPEPTGGGIVIVSYPFIFNPAEQGR